MGTFFLIIFLFIAFLLLVGSIMKIIPLFKEAFKNISIIFKEINKVENNRKKTTDHIKIVNKNLEKKFDLNFTAIDFETANESPTSACSIGIVIVKNGAIIDKKEFLIKPFDNRFNAINISIHGITQEQVKNAPLFSELWSELKPFIENKIVLAHNASFDINVLNSTLKSYNLEIPYFQFACTQKLAQEGFSDLKNYRLNDVAEFLEIEHQHHNSLSDAIISAEIGIQSIPKIKRNRLDFESQDITQHIQKKSSEKSKSRSKRPELYADKKIDKSLLKSNLDNVDPNNYFYNKNVIFTGNLNQMSRKEAAEIIFNMGANIKTTISKKIQIVITGANPGPSKLKQIEDVISKGTDITILNEEDFLSKIK